MVVICVGSHSYMYASVYVLCLFLCLCFWAQLPFTHLEFTRVVIYFVTMFAKFCISAVAATMVGAEDPSVTMFLADSGHAASMWQDEHDFESGVRRVMQMQTADLEKMVQGHPKSLLLQTEIATQKVEDLAATIHLAADATKTLTKDSDALNACNYVIILFYGFSSRRSYRFCVTLFCSGFA